MKLLQKMGDRIKRFGVVSEDVKKKSRAERQALNSYYLLNNYKSLFIELITTFHTDKYFMSCHALDWKVFMRLLLANNFQCVLQCFT